MHAGWIFLLLLDHGTPPAPSTTQLYPWLIYGGILRYEDNPLYYGDPGDAPGQFGTVGELGSMAITETRLNEAVTPITSIAITPAPITEAVT